MPEKVIFKGKVGSRAFGTSTPLSDEDVATIFICDKNDLLGFKYKEHDDIDKDNRRYEVGKFLKLLIAGNPNMLEILHSPVDCILEETEEFRMIKRERERFITRNLYNTFANYARTQITKAKGLNKMINWEGSKVERKDILDFCYFYEFGGGTKPVSIKDYLKVYNLKQEQCALVGLDHFRYSYLVYVDWLEGFSFRGICKEGANNVHTSSVPTGLVPEGILYCNLDGYSTHCKDYASYQTWLSKRNEVRFDTNKEHGQGYDSKNIMHVVRLLKTARDIAEKGIIKVRRDPEEVKYLLSIKSGEQDLGKLVDWANEEYQNIKELFNNSSLPEKVDEEFVHELLVKIRNYETK